MSIKHFIILLSLLSLTGCYGENRKFIRPCDKSLGWLVVDEDGNKFIETERMLKPFENEEIACPKIK